MHTVKTADGKRTCGIVVGYLRNAWGRELVSVLWPDGVTTDAPYSYYDIRSLYGV